MHSLKVLNVTLRNGGCVNDFNSGQTYMETILAAQEASGVDIIEMVYIDEKRGSVSGRTQYINEQVISSSILRHKKPGVTYVAMVDYGKFDINQLAPRTPNLMECDSKTPFFDNRHYNTKIRQNATGSLFCG